MAAPVPIDKAAAAGTSSATNNTFVPATVAVGDILVLVSPSAQPTTPVTSTPTLSGAGGALGWNVAADFLYTTAAALSVGRITVWWRRVAATSEAGLTITLTRTGDVGTDTVWLPVCFKIRGCETTGNPFDAVATKDGAGSTTVGFNAVTVSGTERTLIGILCHTDDTPTFTAPTGYAQTIAREATTVGIDQQVNIFDKQNVSTDGAINSATAGTATWGSVLISFKPPAGGAAQTLTGVSGGAHTRAFGTAQLNRAINEASVIHSRAFGTATLVRGGVTISTSAVVHTRAFGTAVLGQKLSPPSVIHSRAFGSPIVSPGPRTVTTSSVVHARAFGTAKLGIPLLPSSVIHTRAFGTPTVSRGAVTITTQSVVHSRVIGGLSVAGVSTSRELFYSVSDSFVGAQSEKEHLHG